MIGEIKAFGAATVPAGHLLCDGSLVSRTTYASLFGVIGTTWGSGDGSTTFKLPYLLSRVLVGSGQGSELSNYDVGDLGGVESVTLSGSQIPSHTHSIQCYSEYGNSYDPTGCYLAYDPNGTAEMYVTDNTDGVMAADVITNFGEDGSHENRQPYGAVSFIIEY